MSSAGLGEESSSTFGHAAIIAARADERRMFGGPWQPAATAPKDRPIQTWDGVCQVVVEWDHSRAGFYLVQDGPPNEFARARWKFTHWHDLLEPPR